MKYENITKKELTNLCLANYKLANIKITTDDKCNRTMTIKKDLTLNFKKSNEFLSICFKLTSKDNLLENIESLYNNFRPKTVNMEVY